MTPTASAASTPDAPAAQPTRLVRMDAAGDVQASDGLSFVAQKLATYGATGIAAAGETFGTAYPGTLDDTSKLVVSTMSGSGSIRSTTISGLRGFGVDALAGDPQGNVALLVFNTRERIVYLRGKGSSTFTKVLTIKVSDQARGATLAVGGRSGGEILVAYEDHHTLYARHRGTRSWGSVHQLGDSVQSDISAAFDGSGRESVAWKSQRINEGESNTPAIVSFTTAAPGKAFGPPRQIESVSGPSGAGHYVASPAVLLRVVDDTHTLLTWTGSNGAHFVVKAETIASGHTATPATLSPALTDDSPGHWWNPYVGLPVPVQVLMWFLLAVTLLTGSRAWSRVRSSGIFWPKRRGPATRYWRGRLPSEPFAMPTPRPCTPSLPTDRSSMPRPSGFGTPSRHRPPVASESVGSAPCQPFGRMSCEEWRSMRSPSLQRQASRRPRSRSRPSPARLPGPS